MMICYPTSRNFCALPGSTRTPEIVFSVMLHTVSQKRHCDCCFRSSQRVYTRRAMRSCATSLLNACCVVGQRSPRRWWCPLLFQNWAALSCSASSRGESGRQILRWWVSEIKQAKGVSFSIHGMEHNWKDTISWVRVSPGSAETLVRRGGITNHRLIAYSLSNISAKSYHNRLMCVEVIVCNITVVILRHSVYCQIGMCPWETVILYLCVPH